MSEKQIVHTRKRKKSGWEWQTLILRKKLRFAYEEIRELKHKLKRQLRPPAYPGMCGVKTVKRKVNPDAVNPFVHTASKEKRGEHAMKEIVKEMESKLTVESAADLLRVRDKIIVAEQNQHQRILFRGYKRWYWRRFYASVGTVGKDKLLEGYSSPRQAFSAILDKGFKVYALDSKQDLINFLSTSPSSQKSSERVKTTNSVCPDCGRDINDC